MTFYRHVSHQFKMGDYYKTLYAFLNDTWWINCLLFMCYAFINVLFEFCFVIKMNIYFRTILSIRIRNVYLLPSSSFNASFSRFPNGGRATDGDGRSALPGGRLRLSGQQRRPSRRHARDGGQGAMWVNHMFVCLFVCSFVRSFVLPSVRSFVRSSVRLSVHPSVRPFVRSFVR